MSEDTPPSSDIMNKVFKSKVTVIASYVKNIDKTPPVAKITTTITDSGVVVDASSSTDDDSGVENYYYSLDQKTWIKTKNSNYTFTEEEGTITHGKAVDVIANLAKQKVTEVYVKVEDKFENMSEVVRNDVRLTELAYDHTIDNNLRYIGPNPNNYVTFNNELWRIVGSFNNIVDGEGNSATRLKIIRKESIGNLQWDSASKNNWANASLKTYLNGSYYQSIIEENRNMIKDSLWYLGVFFANATYSRFIPIDWYRNVERGKNVYSGNPTTWTGKIALIYTSDYGFATTGTGSVNGRNNCLNRVIKDWANNWGSCSSSSWMHVPKSFAITPTCSNSGSVLKINESNSSTSAGASLPTKPTLYLDGKVKIISGTGTIDNPFQLSM